jgi:hypothetical protein
LPVKFVGKIFGLFIGRFARVCLWVLKILRKGFELWENFGLGVVVGKCSLNISVGQEVSWVWGVGILAQANNYDSVAWCCRRFGVKILSFFFWPMKRG